MVEVHMTLSLQKWLTLAALLGLAHWFFGNLYEAVVFSPNWVVETPAQLARMHGLFVRTSPTAYFVPVTQLATVLAWGLLAVNREPGAARAYRRAGVLAAAATALNAFIVSTIVVELFAADFAGHAAELHALAVRWNVLNAGRMALVAATMAYLFAAFRRLDRLDGSRLDG